ncbi:unnamed protein product [Mytilus edulis]|uniref:Uncharacterized protein n=1 Tax=Mytilus edulis TaxID=6550 RepID=A0A8S3QX96_MYTED|nr:unnamed protein product [Mytilus edulis]
MTSAVLQKTLKILILHASLPTSDMGSSDSISSVNSGNEEKDQNSTSNGDQGQDQLTDSDYSSDSSNNCVSKTSLKQSETTSHRKIDSSMDNSTTCNKDMELLLDYLDIDLDSFDIDDQTFEVEMNALDNEDKNLQVCDKDRNLMNDEIQMSNKIQLSVLMIPMLVVTLKYFYKK